MNHVTSQHTEYIIQLERNGRVSAEHILEDAKREESPLHELYDWNIESAAHAHWLDRTRQILRLVRYIEHTHTETYHLPRYVRDPEAHPKEQGYVTVQALSLDPNLSRRALITELERVTAMLRRSRRIAMGLSLQHELDELLARVTGLAAIASETPTRTDTGGSTAQATA